MSDIDIELDIILGILFFFAAILLPIDWVNAAWNMSATSFITFTTMVCAFGACVGSIIRRNTSHERRPGYFERRRIEREKREREERERIEKEERDRRLRRNLVLGLDSNMKSFLYEIAEYDSIEVPLNDDHIKELRSRLSLMGECAIECTNVGTRDGDKYWRVSLSDLGKQVVAECPNILKEAKDFESR